MFFYLDKNIVKIYNIIKKYNNQRKGTLSLAVKQPKKYTYSVNVNGTQRKGCAVYRTAFLRSE